MTCWPNMPGLSRRRDLQPTKTITVYKNGDSFSPGRKIVVNPRQVLTFDSLLSSLTREVDAPFGAVRKLYSPETGHRVWFLEELIHGSVYVAAGNEHLKKLNYGEGANRRQQLKSVEKIYPVVHSRLLVSARWQKTADESCTINVFTNGQILVPPARVRIPKYTLQSWEKVLAMVTEKVNLRTGAVLRLCTLDGCAICGSYELQNQQYYVAVGAEKFKALPYNQCVPGGDITRRNIVQHVDINPAARKKRHAKTVFPIGSFGEDLENAGRGRIKKDTTQSERSNQQRQVSTNPVSLSIGEGSVFNAQNKRSEMVGAAEVPDARQLKVDLPIDQVEAETVDEDGSCSTNPSVTPRHDSDSSTLLNSPVAGSTENRPLDGTPEMMCGPNILQQTAPSGGL